MTLRALIIAHGHTESEASEAMWFARRDDFAHIDDRGVWFLVENNEEIIDQKYLDAVDKVMKARAHRVWYRCAFDWLWSRFDRIAPPLALLIATTFLAICLCCQEVPTWVMRGIAQVETGTTWHDIGQVSGTYKRGTIGEVGPWQLSPAVLIDLRASSKAARIHRDVVLAESLTRAWLLRLYGITNSWPTAVAAYHAGLGKRSAPYAVAYAARVADAGAQ